MALRKAIAVVLAGCILSTLECLGVLSAATVVPPTDESLLSSRRLLQAHQSADDAAVRFADPDINLPPGESLGLVFNKVAPLPGTDDAFVVLASWTGRLLSSIPGNRLVPSWPAAQDGKTHGCVIACFKGNGSQFCASDTPIVSIGSGFASASCRAADLVAVVSKARPGSWDVYASGSFKGEVLVNKKGGGAGAASPIMSSCVSAAGEGCGFIAVASVTSVGFRMSLEEFDYVRGAGRASEPDSFVGQLSPSRNGVWLSGTVSRGSGHFGGGVNPAGGEFPLSTGPSKPRGFLAYFANADFGFGLSWAHSLSDGRVTSGVPRISRIINSPDCAVVFADEFAAGSTVFHASQKPAVISISEPSTIETGGLPSAIMGVSFQILPSALMANACRNPLAEGAASFLDSWKITDTGKVAAVAAWFDAGSLTSAQMYAAVVPSAASPSTSAGLYKSSIKKLRLGSYAWGEKNFGSQIPSGTLLFSEYGINASAVRGMSYDPHQEALQFALQRDPQICTIGSFSDVNRTALFVDVDPPGCSCSLSSFISTYYVPEQSEDAVHTVAFTGVRGAGCSPKPEGSFGGLRTGIWEGITISPERAVAELQAILDDKSKPVSRDDLQLTALRLDLFPENATVVTVANNVAGRAVDEASVSDEGLSLRQDDMDRLSNIISVGTKIPQSASKATETLLKLPAEVLAAASSSQDVDAKTQVLTSLLGQFGDTEGFRESSLSAVEGLLSDIVTSDYALPLDSDGYSNILGLLREAEGLKGLEEPSRDALLKVPAAIAFGRSSTPEVTAAVEELAVFLQERGGAEGDYAVAVLEAAQTIVEETAASPKAELSPRAFRTLLNMTAASASASGPSTATAAADLADSLAQDVIRGAHSSTKALEKAIKTLATMDDALKESPASSGAVLRALGELQAKALKQPGVELTDAAVRGASDILSGYLVAGTVPDAAETLPFLLIKDSTTSEELESDVARLAGLSPLYQGSSAASAMVEATNQLVDTALANAEIRATPEAVDHALAILAIGRESPFSQVKLRSSEVATRVSAAVVVDENKADSDVARDAIQLRQIYESFKDEPGIEKILGQMTKSVSTLLERIQKPENNITLGLLSLDPILSVLRHISDGPSLGGSARAVASQVPRTIIAKPSRNTGDVDTQLMAITQTARLFVDDDAVLDESVLAVSEKVKEIQQSRSLRFTQEALQDALYVLSLRLRASGSSQAQARFTLEALPFACFETLEEGEVLQVGVDDVQLTVARSTPPNPVSDLTTQFSTSASGSMVKSTTVVTSTFQIPETTVNEEPHYMFLRHMAADLVQPAQDMDPLEDPGNRTSQGILTMQLVDPITGSARRLRQASEVSATPPSTFSVLRKPGFADNARREAGYRARGEASECVTSNPLTGEISNAECVTRPTIVPRGFETRFNPAYKRNAAGDSMEPLWLLEPVSTEYAEDCTTTRIQQPYRSPRPSQALFGDVSFQGPGCWFYDENQDDPFAERKLPTIGYNCFWDDLAQMFAGPDCVIQSDMMFGCMCLDTEADFWVSRVPMVTDIVTRNTRFMTVHDEFGEKAAQLANQNVVLFVVIPLAGVVGSALLLVIFAWFWDKRRRQNLLKKLLQTSNSFESDSQEHTGIRRSKSTQLSGKSRKAFSMNELCGKLWKWSMETQVFNVLADDLEYYMALSEGRQTGYTLFNCNVVNLWSVLGLPFDRALACIPDGESLSWVPQNGQDVDIIHWRNLALGTSMVMGFLLNNDILSDELAQAQIEKQDMHFAGCHPMGFRALVRRWRVMLHRSNIQDYRPGWHERCRVWKLIWLQRHDGLWDLTEDFKTAIGADPELLLGVYSGKVKAQAGVESIKGQIPDGLEVLFYGDQELLTRVWCTFLAKAFLENAAQMFADFSGREPDAKSGAPTLPTVIAEDAIRYQVGLRRMDEMLRKDLKDKHYDTMEALIASADDDAKVAVRSFEILRGERQKAWASVELEDYTGETQRDRQLRKIKEGSEPGFSRKDFARLLVAWDARCLLRTWRTMCNRGSEIDESGIMKTVNVVRSIFEQIFRFVTKYNGTVRIAFSSIIDTLMVSERTAVACATMVAMMSFLAWMFNDAAQECCGFIKEYYDCGPNSSPEHPEHCVRFKVERFRSPAGIRYSSNTTELISSGVSCEYLLLEFPPFDNSFDVPFGEPQPTPPTQCEVFPNPLITGHVIRAGLLAALYALPIKILLKMIFNARRRYAFSGLWVTRHGLVGSIMGLLGFSDGLEKQGEAQIASLAPVEDYSAKSLQPVVVVTSAAAAAAEKSPHKTKGRAATTKAEEIEEKAAPRRLPRATTSTLDESQSSEDLPDASMAVSVMVRRRSSDGSLRLGRSGRGSRGAPRMSAHGETTVSEAFRMRPYEPPSGPTSQDQTAARRQTIHAPGMSSTDARPRTRSGRRHSLPNSGAAWASKSVPDLRHALDREATTDLPGEDPRGTGTQQPGSRLSLTSQRLLNSRNKRMPPPMLKQHASYI